MSLYNPCSRNHVGKVFYYLFGTIRGVCCQKWSVNRGGGAKEFCDLKITCQFFSVNNTGEITAQYEAIFARYIITDVFVFVCNENPYLMWNLAKSPWLEALISGSIKFFLSIMRYKMMPRFCWFNQWENWSFAVTQNPKLNCKLEVKKNVIGFRCIRKVTACCDNYTEKEVCRGKIQDRKCLILWSIVEQIS